MKKVVFKIGGTEDDNVVHIDNMNNIHILINDAEADLILVDDFLSDFSYQDVGNVLNLILSKLRINGTIVVNFVDGELAAYNLTRGFMTLEEYNDLVFYKPIKSVINTSIVVDLLKSFNISVESKIINKDNNVSVVTGRRYE